MNKIVPGKYKCSHCKKYLKREKVIIHSRGLRNGVSYEYYYCNPCNTKRLRAYFNTEKGRYNLRKAIYKSISLNKEKQDARMKINYQIKKGNIVRPKICPKCKKRKKTEAHHPDHCKPLKVKFMCRQCHAIIHRKHKVK